jgi:hypothetical protein
MKKVVKKARTKITPKLESQVDRVRAKARNYIARSEVLQFRLDEKTYQGLFDIAEREGKAVGTLVREWVTSLVKQRRDLDTQPAVAKNFASKIEAKLAAMQKQLDNLSRSAHQKNS